MNKIKLLIGASTILFASAFTAIKLVDWKVKDGYQVKCVEVGAYFKGLKAIISFDEDKPEKSKVSASIDVKSIDMNASSANEEAKKILEADKFPSITFESTAITKTGQGKYDATGNLALKGITKEIKFPFNFDSKKSSDRYPFVSKETFGATFTFSPKEFNIEMEKHMEKFTIELIIPVTK